MLKQGINASRNDDKLCSLLLCDGAGCCRIVLSNHLAKLSVIVDAFLSLQSNLNLSFYSKLVLFHLISVFISRFQGRL